MEMWQRESEGANYSIAEKDAVERAIAEVLLAYQIKFVQENKVMPEDLNIEDYCSIDTYGRVIKDILIEKVHESDGDNFKQLQLIDLFRRTDIIEIINNERLWRELTGVPVTLTSHVINRKEEDKEEVVIEEPPEEPVQETALVPVNKEKDIIVSVKCKVEVKPFLGKKRIQEKEISFNLGRDGTLSIPERLRKSLVGIEIPEEVRHIADEGFKRM